MEYNNLYIEKFLLSNENTSIILIQNIDKKFKIYYDCYGVIEIYFDEPSSYIRKLKRIHLANGAHIIFKLPRNVHIMSISKIRKEKTKLIIYEEDNFVVGYDEKKMPALELIQEQMPERNRKPGAYMLKPIKQEEIDLDLDLNL